MTKLFFSSNFDDVRAIFISFLVLGLGILIDMIKEHPVAKVKHNFGNVTPKLLSICLVVKSLDTWHLSHIHLVGHKNYQ